MIEDALLPVCVDLDGTLVREETLWVLLRLLGTRRPLVLLWLMSLFFYKGRAAFKKALAQEVTLNPALLSYNKALLQDLKAAFLQGNLLVLATGADLHLAQKIADHVGIFKMVLASNGSQNLVGKAKATVLTNAFGAGKFIYAGNSWKDVPVWECAAHMIVVNAPPRLIKALEKKPQQKQLKVYA